MKIEKPGPGAPGGWVRMGQARMRPDVDHVEGAGLVGVGGREQDIGHLHRHRGADEHETGHLLDVEHVQAGVAEGLAEQ